MPIIYATKLTGLRIINNNTQSSLLAHTLKLRNNVVLAKSKNIEQYKHLLISGQGNTGQITGKVTEKGLPVVRRVMCYHRLSKALISSTWSDIYGDYFIDGLIAGVRYYVTSLDENGDDVQYNAVTQDLITASRVTL